MPLTGSNSSSAVAGALATQLTKYSLTPAHYREINTTLERFGYNDVQREKIILRRRSKAIFSTLSKLHTELSTLGYDHQQLTSIAAHDGGSRNLTAVQKNHDALKDLDFTVDEIVKIARREQGKKNLEAVQKNHDALKELGFTAGEIVTIISGDKGRKQLALEIAKRQQAQHESDAVSMQELPDIFMVDAPSPLPLRITIAAYNDVVIQEPDSPSPVENAQKIQTRRAAAESRKLATSHAERAGKRQKTSPTTYLADASPSDKIEPLREWAAQFMPSSPASVLTDSPRPQSPWSQRSASPAGAER